MYHLFIKPTNKKMIPPLTHASANSNKSHFIYTLGKASELTLGRNGNWMERNSVSFAFIKHY